MDWKRELQAAVQAKGIVLGLEQTIKLLKSGKGRFVVLARDCPEREAINHYAEIAKVPVYDFEGVGFDLGATVKKTFSVSAVLVK